MPERTKIEFRESTALHSKAGQLHVDINNPPIPISSSDFGKIIENIDKRLFTHWSEGVTIFFLTKKQFDKFQSLITLQNKLP